MKREKLLLTVCIIVFVFQAFGQDSPVVQPKLSKLSFGVAPLTSFYSKPEKEKSGCGFGVELNLVHEIGKHFSVGAFLRYSNIIDRLPLFSACGSVYSLCGEEFLLDFIAWGGMLDYKMFNRKRM